MHTIQLMQTCGFFRVHFEMVGDLFFHAFSEIDLDFLKEISTETSRTPENARIGSGALYVSYLISLVSVCVIQIAIMLYILLSKKCGEYLDLLDGVNKEYFEDGNLYTDN